MRRLVFVLIASSIGAFASAQNGARTPNVYAPSACADVALPRRGDSLDTLVIARMHVDRIPAVELSVLRRGRIETRVDGYADLDHCVRADSTTIFAIGSVSKQLTAYATLRLVQAGSIALDDSITKYLPEARPVWDGITIRQLLTHTSGESAVSGSSLTTPREPSAQTGG